MSPRKTPFEIGNFYHCYSRGINKCLTFLDDSDYWYFLESIQFFNRKDRIPETKRRRSNRNKIWKLVNDEPLVAIVAYCLMPNHFHFLLKEITPDGISVFMQRLITGYTMHFKRKYDRSGGLFTRPFRSKHIPNDLYLREVFKYIHLNPSELLGEEGDEGVASYEFSSMPDYFGKRRPQGVLLSKALPW